MIDDAIQLNFHLNNGNHSYDDVHSAIALHAHQPSKSQLNILNFYSIKTLKCHEAALLVYQWYVRDASFQKSEAIGRGQARGGGQLLNYSSVETGFRLHILTNKVLSLLRNIIVLNTK